MKKIEKLQNALKPYDEIIILGHDNIDVDAFLSGILLSNLLDFLRIKNEFLILEKIKKNDSYRIIKELFHIDLQMYYSEEEDEEKKLFLEDHYKTEHAGEVVACLDHHPTKEKTEYPFYFSKKSCSTSYMVYELMEEAGYHISREEARMILVSMMIDTVSFRSAKTVKAETIKAQELAKQYHLDYEEIEKYCLCLTPIKNVPADTIINNGYKYYNYKGKRVKSSYLQLYGMVEEKQITNWIYNIMKKLKEESLVMWVFILFDCKENMTYEYHISKDSVEKVESKGILSRGTNIMPKIEEMLSAS